MADSFSADDVMRALQHVSDDIKREVGTLIDPAAQAMAGRLIARYPRGRKEHPGRKHMDDDVRVRVLSQHESDVPARKVIGPRLASIWQDGTGPRYDATRKNANRGRMPAAAPGFFERTAVEVRAEMLRKAQAILDKPRTFGVSSSGRLL